MDYILDRLPRAEYDIFVDASTKWGIGGCCGGYFFKIPQNHLEQFNTGLIAQKELFAALVAVYCFQGLIKGKLAIIHTDNTNAHDWVLRGRSSRDPSNKALMVFELMKYSAECKLSIQWIPSKSNVSADMLSRGATPRWLRQQGRKMAVNFNLLKSYLDDPISAWRRRLT